MGMTYLARKQSNPPETQDCLNKIEVSSQFLLGLINDILDMSKAENNSIELRPEPYPVADFMEYLDSVIAPLCQQKHQKFSLKTVPVEDVVPLIDVLLFNQIVFNLLFNAVKYTPEGGTVSFSVYDELVSGHRERITLVVKDNGVGMSEAFQKVLFDPLYAGGQQHRRGKSGHRPGPCHREKDGGPDGRHHHGGEPPAEGNDLYRGAGV